MRAMRTLSIPSRAMSRTAASSSRSRPCDPTSELMQRTLVATPTEQSELQARARAFVEEVLMPLEVQAERAGGRLPAERVAEIRREALARRLGGGLHAVEHG